MTSLTWVIFTLFLFNLTYCAKHNFSDDKKLWDLRFKFMWVRISLKGIHRLQKMLLEKIARIWYACSSFCCEKLNEKEIALVWMLDKAVGSSLYSFVGQQWGPARGRPSQMAHDGFLGPDANLNFHHFLQLVQNNPFLDLAKIEIDTVLEFSLISGGVGGGREKQAVRWSGSGAESEKRPARVYWKLKCNHSRGCWKNMVNDARGVLL